jgi:hypothetical protein
MSLFKPHFFYSAAKSMAKPPGCSGGNDLWNTPRLAIRNGESGRAESAPKTALKNIFCSTKTRSLLGMLPYFRTLKSARRLGFFLFEIGKNRNGKKCLTG